jgi:hypothetical protein
MYEKTYENNASVRHHHARVMFAARCAKRLRCIHEKKQKSPPLLMPAGYERPGGVRSTHVVKRSDEKE